MPQSQNHDYISRDEFDKFQRNLKEDFVSVERYTPVERLVYGLVGLALTALVVALLASLLRGGGL